MDENESLADPLVRRDITPSSDIGQREQNLAQREQNLTEDKSRFATKTDIFEKTSGRYWWYAGMIVLVLVALGLATGALVKETSNVSSLEAAVTPSTSFALDNQLGIAIQPSGTTSILGLDFTEEGTLLNTLCVSAGTAEANKALVLDASKGISGVSTFTGVSLIEAETINVTNLNYSNFTVSGNFETGDLDTNHFFSSPNTAINSGIIGGDNNTNIGASCFIGGGKGNNLDHDVSLSGIIGGRENVINTGSFHSGIIGGRQNGISGPLSQNSGIVGGFQNEISGTESRQGFIGGGNGNNIIGTLSRSSGIVGGLQNEISGSESRQSFIGGGGENEISGTLSRNSGIIGGYNNIIEGTESPQSFIAGGTSNIITGTLSRNSGIIGGTENRISGETQSLDSGIFGGRENGVSGNYSIVLAGRENVVLSSNSGIVAGRENLINTNSNLSFIAGGVSNSISDVSMSTILGGSDNNIRGTGTSCGIFSSFGSSIVGGKHSIIIGGNNNHLGQSQSGIFAGGNNTIELLNDDEGNTVIVGGGDNRINTDTGGDYGYNGIFSSRESGISGATKHSVIAGGRNHKIDDSENCCIAGGTSLITASGGVSYKNSLICGQYNNPNFFPWDKVSQTEPGASFRFCVGTGLNSSSPIIGFAVDDVGNIYYGNTNNCRIYQRNGSTYTAKSFTIQHPTDDERWLRHGCLEGPEAGVYYRGKDTAPTTIKLPEYAPKIASNFTVQITPIGEPRMISSSEVSEEGSFQVFGEGKFHWHVTGTRLKMEIEPLKKDITIKNFGPYSWSE